MPTPKSTPDEPIPPTNTPPRLPITQRPRPSWALKAGTVVITTTLSPQSSQATGQSGQEAFSEQPSKDAAGITPPHWTLIFQSGMKVPHPTLARIVAAIENLHPGQICKNETVVLELTGADGGLIGFVQVACGEDKPSELGTYIAEIRVNISPDGENWDLLKAGRKEPAGAVVDRTETGLFKTYENECLSPEQVIAIAEHYFTQQECHPDFQWRSIREDVRAFHQKSRKQPSNQDTEKKP